MIARKHNKKAETMDGVQLRNCFIDASHFLEKYKETINSLNVFPVPDGDTGTNLLLTLNSVNQEAASVAGASAERVAEAIARGGLLGARGNSGVILSQFLQGLARGLKGLKRFGARQLAEALELGNQAAYRAVSKPVEGTMLTVIRELSLAARTQAESGDGDVVNVWESALKAAKRAVSRTPLQLPVLKEAGVVDAGGQGIAVILEGALRFLRHDKRKKIKLSTPILEEPEAVGARVSISKEFLTSTRDELYGYEAQFLIRGEGLDVDAIREKVSTMGDSTVVTGDENLVKVHVHTDDPGPVLSLGVSLGRLHQITVENLDEQHRDFIAQQKVEEAKEVAVLAVTWGEGFTKVFESLGVGGIVSTGQVMNPSAREILKCVEGLAAKEVIVLPNNPNVIPVAEQAAALASKKAHVIPSRTLPQGIAAILAFNPDEDIEANLGAMKSSLNTVSTVAITRATRSSTVKKVRVQKGRYIGLVDDDLVCSGRSIAKVLIEALQHTQIADSNLVTLYWGNGADQAKAKRVARKIQEDYPNVEVEVMCGAQPLYQYIASVE
jgi:hypothetical protein